MSKFSAEAFREGPERDLTQSLMDMARDYRDDPEFRARIEADTWSVLQERGAQLDSDDVELRLRVNTPEVFHLVLPADPNGILSDRLLRDVAGGSSASTAGTAGSGGSVSSFASCLGCASSLSSAGTGGTAGGD